VTEQRLTIVELFPSLLQPEGDHGNAVVLAYRARARGVTTDLLVVHPGDDVPDDASMYLLGGSEDVDVPECARRLRDGGELARAVSAGAAVLGVGAGFEVLARRFDDLDGHAHEGVGLLDVEMTRSSLASGSVVTEPSLTWGLPALSGYEYHVNDALLGPEVSPLAALEVGVGNGPGGEGRHDGAVSGRVVGTWLHGPVLPRNPALADLLLGLVGVRPTPLDDRLADRVRAVRIREARAAAR
jgi:lipid II isoglutaminyl synthase (glutamine-hydrolysing)